MAKVGVYYTALCEIEEEAIANDLTFATQVPPNELCCGATTIFLPIVIDEYR